jgi:hypothetical protein
MVLYFEGQQMQVGVALIIVLGLGISFFRKIIWLLLYLPLFLEKLTNGTLISRASIKR